MLSSICIAGVSCSCTFEWFAGAHEGFGFEHDGIPLVVDSNSEASWDCVSDGISRLIDGIIGSLMALVD